MQRCQKTLRKAQNSAASSLKQSTERKMSTAELVFRGVPTVGQGPGWCRRVGGDMGHTQLKTGVQGGHVEHRGEIKVLYIGTLFQ